jgi:hypothetical protein
LIPNVALTGSADATTIALPAVSLLVYNTGSGTELPSGYYYNSGTAISPVWTRLSTGRADGSETKVEAGTNVTVTGSGTSASPYIVNSTEVDGDVTNEIQDLSINGNTLKITLKGSATAIDLSAYLDNTDNQTLDGILTVNTSAGNKKITSLADPVADQDAATKAYVDLISSPCVLSIGDTHEGGIIFYLDGSGCHGLVAKATDEPGTYQWSTSDTEIWAFAAGIYGGAQNTKKIIYRMGVGNAPAAEQCEGLTDGGFTDWYLPSKDELDMMFVNLHLQLLGGFSSGDYWSSTEFGASSAWRQGFYNGNQFYFKNKYYNVRAVRAF